MEIIDHLLTGFQTSLAPINFGLTALGVLLGLMVGALPGLGSVNGVAILLPMTFLVPPSSAIIFLCAVYYGAMYGGAITSILLGIPGASTAVATTFDGRPMALAGKADQALASAAVASFFGGTVAVVLFTLFADWLADLALMFGPAEEFALVTLAFTTFLGLGGSDKAKTVVSIALGLVLSAVGLDLISGQPRLIFFDVPGFYHGIHFLVLAIGFYGIGEMLATIEASRGGVEMIRTKVTVASLASSLAALRRAATALSIGSFGGFFLGILPAAGATPASLMAYGVTRSAAADKSRFGKGDVRGVVAPESANNSASVGALLPMLTLGIPGSPTTALLLGGMVIWGLQPGPLLFIENQDFVWGLISSLYSANLLALVINLALIPAFVWALCMPFTVLAPIVFVLCVVGGYAPTQDLHDVWLMLGFGVGGFVLRKLDYPLAPAVLAIVLGPILERSLRQTLVGARGDPTVFLDRPIAATFLGLALVFLLLPLGRRLLTAVRRAVAGDGPASALPTPR